MINLQQLINKINANPKLIFLFDGFGALLSIFLLGFVLVQLENIIGMPAKTLYVLAGFAVVFAIYSFTNSFFISKNWKTFLKIIALANLTYCAITFSLLFYHKAELTKIGVVYFIFEIIIISSLALFELKIAKENN